MNHDSLETLKTRLHKFAKERDWDQFHSPNKKVEVNKEKYPVYAVQVSAKKYNEY